MQLLKSNDDSEVTTESAVNNNGTIMEHVLCNIETVIISQQRKGRNRATPSFNDDDRSRFGSQQLDGDVPKKPRNDINMEIAGDATTMSIVQCPNGIFNIDTLNINQKRIAFGRLCKVTAILLLIAAISTVIFYLNLDGIIKTDGSIANERDFASKRADPFGLISRNWTHLTESTIDEMLINYVIAMVWSRRICNHTSNVSDNTTFIEYLKKSGQPLDESKKYLEYLDLSSVFRPHQNSDDFLSVFVRSVNYLNSTYRDGDGIDTISYCGIVQSFITNRNSILHLSNERFAVFLSEFSTNVFTFATFLSQISSMKDVVSDDTINSIPAAYDGVIDYMIDSSIKIRQSFSDDFDSKKIRFFKSKIIERSKFEALLSDEYEKFKVPYKYNDKREIDLCKVNSLLNSGVPEKYLPY